MSVLHDIWEEFHRRLGHIGPVVIAGGAVRDRQLDRVPKDWDIFVLGTYANRGTRQQVRDATADLPDNPTTPFTDYRLGPVVNKDLGGYPIQVMLSEQRTVEELLDQFDWNICQFAYVGPRLQYEDPIIAPNGYSVLHGGELRLHRIGRPITNLRRGFRFAERYDAYLPEETIMRLCRLILERGGNVSENLTSSSLQPASPQSLSTPRLADSIGGETEWGSYPSLGGQREPTAGQVPTWQDLLTQYRGEWTSTYPAFFTTQGSTSTSSEFLV